MYTIQGVLWIFLGILCVGEGDEEVCVVFSVTIKITGSKFAYK